MAFDHQAFVSDLMNRPEVSINQFGRTSTELCVLLGSLILTKGYDKDKRYQSFPTQSICTRPGPIVTSIPLKLVAFDH